MQPVCSALLVGILASSIGLSSISDAAKHTLPLNELNIHETIYLPTVSSQRDIEFTLPRAWQASASGSSLSLHFQHSNQLLPNRSFLEVILNDGLIKRIPLTASNAETTHLTIPLSGGVLKNKNSLKFRVEQHYTHKCEDPVDASLWTQILPETSLSIQYFPKPIKPNIGKFPYPLVDTQAPFPSNVLFSAPSQLDDNTLEALTYLQTRLGSEAHGEELHTHVVYSTPNPKDKTAQQSHWILLGTPDNNAAIATYAKAFTQASLQNGKWVDKSTNQPLADHVGLVKMIQKPGNNSQALLLVTANHSEGLKQAAQFLAHDGIREINDDAEMIINANWASTSFKKNPEPPIRYIRNKTKTLSELGYGDQYVEKLFAPPITYSLPIVTNFAQGNAHLDFDFTYSYGGGLNPRYSSLELILNDRSIANIPLKNVAGEDNAHAKVNLPTELLGVHNRLVAQFHMMPDKFGFCVDHYDDQAWGKIFSTSKLVVHGNPASRLPDAGLLNSTGYPYTQTSTLSNTHWVLANSQPSTEELASYLATAGRIGRTLESRRGYELSASTSVSPLPTNRHAFIIGGSDLFNTFNTNALPLVWNKSGAKQIQTQLSALFADKPDDALIQQGMNGEHAITLITAENNAAFQGVQKLLEHDKQFYKLFLGDVQQIDHQGTIVQSIPSLADGTSHLMPTDTAASGTNNGNDPWWSWLSIFNPITQPLAAAWAWFVALPGISTVASIIHRVLEFFRGLINGFVGLPIISTVINTVFRWINPVLTFGPLAGITHWFKAHTILGFIAGNMVFWTLWGWVMAILKKITGGGKK